MQADWEFEVGGDAPVIDAHWAGLVDLRANPALAATLPEAADLPALAAALQTLHGPGSPVWTSKCDFWPELEAADFDADEMDAPPGAAAHAACCYIDLLPCKAGAWQHRKHTEAACNAICTALHAVPVRCCRMDLVVRRAVLHPGREPGVGQGIDKGLAAGLASDALEAGSLGLAALKPGPTALGITAYVTACGPTAAEAKSVLAEALAAFAAALSSSPTLQ